MQFPKWNQQQENPGPSSTLNQSNTCPCPQQQQQQHQNQNFLLNIQNNCSNFLQNLSNTIHQHQQNLNLPPFNPQHAFQNLIHQAKHKFSQTVASRKKLPVWARVSAQNESVHRFDLAMSTEAIEERLAGIAVYALSNSAEEFMLISGAKSGKALGLFCFKKEDAEALLGKMKSMNPDMRSGSRVVSVALNKVFQLKLEGVAFRFIPDPTQVKNALEEKEKAGLPAEGFSGVPIFQSQSLILRSQNKRYRPVFFRKEDLENSLLRASEQQNELNPLLRPGAIEVAVLEDVIQGMKNPTSKWDDVVFIPPGYDVSTNLPQQKQLTASG